MRLAEHVVQRVASATLKAETLLSQLMLLDRIHFCNEQFDYHRRLRFALESGLLDEAHGPGTRADETLYAEQPITQLEAHSIVARMDSTIFPQFPPDAEDLLQLPFKIFDNKK